MIKFGSIFRYNENYYVYLGQTEDIIYAARILNRDQTKELQRLDKNSENKHIKRPIDDSTIFCFVILSTDNFHEQAASLHNSQYDTDVHPELIGELNSEDVENLKKEIEEKSAIPSSLKEIVRRTFQ
ncbi:MAG: hypothetical protein G01um101429_329 [Parcubacteria group bacterium Gr01-1014_29]|nr:MAG: hypothetical protein G01um101429_329 [Parcubacteria group bacterium Gr01-1014_29]